MGSPIAPLMEDVFMNWLLDNVNKIGCSPHIICRYVDQGFSNFWCYGAYEEIDHNLRSPTINF